MNDEIIVEKNFKFVDYKLTKMIKCFNKHQDEIENWHAEILTTLS